MFLVLYDALQTGQDNKLLTENKIIEFINEKIGYQIKMVIISHQHVLAYDFLTFSLYKMFLGI